MRELGFSGDMDEKKGEAGIVALPFFLLCMDNQVEILSVFFSA